MYLFENTGFPVSESLLLIEAGFMGALLTPYQI
jgi:hypothetical protein